MKYNSALMTAASGSMGGIVASHNRGGQYFRKRVVPTNPNTAQQQAVRDNLSILQVRFANTLTTVQRTGWQSYATGTPVTNAMGATITLTGQQMYVKANTLRLQAGVAPVDAPPAVNGLIALTTPISTIIAAGTTASIAFTNTDAWANVAGGYMLIFASRSQNVTINSFKGPYRFAAKVTGSATPPTSPSVVTLPWSIGAAGTKMFFRAVAIGADGRPSPTVRFSSSA